MSTQPPSDPWGSPADRPDEPEPEQPPSVQPTADQPATDQPLAQPPGSEQPPAEPPTPDQPLAQPPGSEQPPAEPPTPDQPLAQPPVPEQPPADPWAAPPVGQPTEPMAGAGFDRPATDFTTGEQPPAYPPAPMPPQVPYGEQRPKPTPPSSIRTAVMLMYAGAALSAIGLLFGFLTQESLRDQALSREPSLTESEIDAIVSFTIAVTVVIGLIGVLLWVWMAETNRRGKSWARIVATVLGALNILLVVFGLTTQQYSGTILVFNLISAALAAVILYFLYRPDSSAYYEAMSDIRR